MFRIQPFEACGLLCAFQSLKLANKMFCFCGLLVVQFSDEVGT